MWSRACFLASSSHSLLLHIESVFLSFTKSNITQNIAYFHPANIDITINSDSTTSAKMLPLVPVVVLAYAALYILT